MKKKNNTLSYSLLILLIGLGIFGCKEAPKPEEKQDVKETAEQKAERMKWWEEARFGMFIHWGIYSVPAGVYNGKDIPGIGEWIMNNGKIPVAEYAKYAEQFNPMKYNAEQWVLLAKEAGMKYIVITSKHHDGFAMFATKASPYNIVDATPFKRDPLKELAEACKKHGMRLGFYYSQAQDWHHTGGSAIGGHWDSIQNGSMDEYIDKIAVPQVKEILSNYGQISVLWWDTPENMTKERAEKFLPILKLQPGIIYNNRLGGGYDGDLETPEQFIPATGIPGKNWESCMTMNDTWGFKSNDHNWKSTKALIQNLVDIASKGGNYLLNVGPTSEGLIPDSSVVRLKKVGEWMKINSEAIYATKASPFKYLEWGRCTQKNENGITRLYLNVFNWPKDGKLVVSGLLNEPKLAYLLSDSTKKALTVTRKEDALIIDVEKTAPDKICSVVVLDITGEPNNVDPPAIENDITIFTDKTEVVVTPNKQGFEMRYTIDGSQPNSTSPIVDKAITIDKTTKVSVRLFKDGKPFSGSTQVQFTKVKPNPAVKVENAIAGLHYAYYTGSWDKLPDFKTLTVIEEGTVPEFVLSPAKQKNDYGFVYSGFVKIPVEGVYTFYTESDDGSRLFIGDQKIVENDGLHAMEEKSGSIALSAGFHPIRVIFFQKGGGDGLKVSYKSGNVEKAVIPGSILFYKK